KTLRVLKQCEVEPVLHAMHADLLAGHFGKEGTCQRVMVRLRLSIRRMFKDTDVAEVCIMATTITFFNSWEEPASLTPTPEGTYSEKLNSIYTTLKTGIHDQQEIPVKKGKFALKTASRMYQLYQARGFYNLLGNKSITANIIYRMSEEDFQLLLGEAREI
ncbi:26212_t:CDS:2, partial [Gigaspora rosea]